MNGRTSSASSACSSCCAVPFPAAEKEGVLTKYPAIACTGQHLNTHTHTHTHIHTRTHIRTHTHGHTHTHTRLRPSLFLYVVVKYLPSARKPTKAQARRSNSTCVTRALKYVCIACTTAACASAASMCSCPSAEEHIAVSAPRATAWQSSKQRVNACACACVCVGG